MAIPTSSSAGSRRIGSARPERRADGDFAPCRRPAGAAARIAAQFVDYDNDGLLDLLTIRSRRHPALRQMAGTVDRRRPRGRPAGGSTPSAAAAFSATASAISTATAIRTSSLLLDDRRLRFLRNDGGNRNASLRVRLTARVSNRSGVGAKVEMRAGSLRQMLEPSSSSPAVAPADLVFGLGSASGRRRRARAVAIRHSAGRDDQPRRGRGRARRFTITELDRKPSSCPYLFTWNGIALRVRDRLHGRRRDGRLGRRRRSGTTRSRTNTSGSAALSWSRATADTSSGITNELEEALFFDRLQLLAVDHRGRRGRLSERRSEVARRVRLALTAVQRAAAARARARRARPRCAGGAGLARSPLSG